MPPKYFGIHGLRKAISSIFEEVSPSRQKDTLLGRCSGYSWIYSVEGLMLETSAVDLFPVDETKSSRFACSP